VPVGSSSREYGFRDVVRWLMGALGVLFVLEDGYSSGVNQGGAAFLEWVSQGVPAAEARRPAFDVILVTFALSVSASAVLWMGLSLWQPQSRHAYAVRFSLWPFVCISGWIVKPLATANLDIDTGWATTIMYASVAVPMMGGVLGILWYGIGLLLWTDRLTLYSNNPVSAITADLHHSPMSRADENAPMIDSKALPGRWGLAGAVLGLFGLWVWAIPLLGLIVAIAGFALSLTGMNCVRKEIPIAGLLLSITSMALTAVNGFLGPSQ
jgi:hypothetical protein